MAEVTDESWAQVARNSRAALKLLGRDISNCCLPGEPQHDQCGATFAEHAMAQLAVLKAVADHQLQHLGGQAIVMSAEIYQYEREILEEGCGRHA